jgi:hypothetical protein
LRLLDSRLRLVMLLICLPLLLLLAPVILRWSGTLDEGVAIGELAFRPSTSAFTAAAEFSACFNGGRSAPRLASFLDTNALSRDCDANDVGVLAKANFYSARRRRRL